FILEKEAFGVLFRSNANSNGYMWQINTVLEGGPYLRPHIQRNGGWTQSQIPLAKFFKEPLDFSKPHTLTIEAKGKRLQTSLDGVLIDDREDDAFAAGRIGLRTAVRERALIEHLTLTDAKGTRVYDLGFDRTDNLPFRAPRIEKGRLVLDNRTDYLGNALTKTCPRFRKTFTLPDKPIRYAFASVSGLGFYELYLNGKKVGDHVTAPANTDYRHRIFFDTLDVTESLKPGAANTAGIWLGAGYADDYSVWGWKWEQIKRAILHLKVTFEDGTAQTLVTDGTWRMTHHSPLSYASLYNGESYNAGQEDPAWCLPSYPPEMPGWTSAPVLPALDIPLVPAIAPPVRVVETCSPVTVTEPRPGIFVADFGQNRAGWVRIRAKGPRGTTIVLRHSELLGPDGMIDPWTNRGAKARDAFVLAGTGDWETYEPRFTYHGFQFVEITGYPGRPSPADITGCAIHADVEPAGTFHCSDPRLNKLDLCAHWSMLSNLQAIPTDCPMRDERTPCQMDSQAYEDTAIAHFWMPRYYAKWLGDITGGRGNPDWNGDAVTLPALHYLHYGDPRILEEHFANMAAVTDDVARRYPDLIAKDGFGDWCAPNDGSWEGFHNQVPIVNTAIFGQMAHVTADAARVLGKTQDAETYDRLAARIEEAFIRAFHKADTHTFGDGGQTAFVMPLALLRLSDAIRQPAAAQLAKTIRQKDRSRVGTGIYGTRYLADILCGFGEADLAVTLMTQPQYPGFGFMFANGATTLWEQWTFRGGMNSHNHAMFAGGAYWLYSCLGGITPAQPGYAQIRIQPVFPQTISHVQVSRETVRGTCQCVWRRDPKTKPKRFQMTVTGPVT
ncbi:MAG: family 78 glycoside hydrolase catalytic domain, partial [Kiritimatiellae bacterium]|nr:family 78 glycoside hydrolase catalytic domain [Kiritimatiellia bacterium]